jgi:hypothetical protein
MRLRCVASVGPYLVDLSSEITDKDVRSALPVLEKIRTYLDSHRS